MFGQTAVLNRGLRSKPFLRHSGLYIMGLENRCENRQEHLNDR